MEKEYGGVSFIVRVRNEAGRLELALRSLVNIKIRHEIVVICHLCSDDSKAVAERAMANGQPIHVFEYTLEVSKPGYETMVTPIDHPGSYIRFVNWCYAKARFAWTFKWDADFVATEGLLYFVNEKLGVHCTSPIAYKMGVQLGPELSDTGPIVHHEVYLCNCLVKFVKCKFWELQEFPHNVEKHTLGVLISSIPPSVLKPYWLLKPWFTCEATRDDDLCQKYDRLVDICGSEAAGLARACSPDYRIEHIDRNRDVLATHKILFYEGWDGPC